METEIQDSNPDLGFHETALLLNRLVMALTVLSALVEIECQSRFKSVLYFSYRCISVMDAKISQIRHRTVSLPDFRLREMIHSAKPERLPFVIWINASELPPYPY